MISTRQRLFSAEEYYKMADLGILHPEERVELLEGYIVTMAAKTPLHSATTKCTADYLQELLKGVANIRIHQPIRLNSQSEPEPDIAVVRPNHNDYVDHHPTPEEVFLIIEVADTTLNFDRKNKAAIYAKAQIPDY